jgi:UDP-N-acetylmuramate dehydrogenase
MSEIPGSLGGAVFINITAYGQSIGSVVEWVDTWDPATRKVVRFSKDELSWGYKSSIFQQKEHAELIILRACLELSHTKTTDLTYQKAVDVAEELSLDTSSLADRRTIIIESRKRAGSLWHPSDKKAAHTVGSFFRNPIVTQSQAEKIISFDETGKTVEQIKNMNKVHGGSTRRVSAAHVMLASGFKRGQLIGNVKLNEQNLLKLEATETTTASDIYDTMRYIQKTCFDSVGVTLEPEARILGSFTT